MEMTLRPMTGLESLYCYTQSQQIMAQTGCIGHLRLDCGPDGKDFYTSWEDHSRHLNTHEFKAFFDDAVNALRSDAQYHRILHSRWKNSSTLIKESCDAEFLVFRFYSADGERNPS